MSDKVQRFLDEQRPATPCLVVDLDVVEGKYRSLTGSLPLADVFYAV
jgi:ornithine decarboxylase